jgi:hypothetical protein
VRLPEFTLRDTEGTEHRVPSGSPAATVVVATCNHCPYVIAWNPRLRAVAEDYAGRDVCFLAVNGNDAERHPADSLEHMRRFVREQDWPIPYLHDPTQEVLRELGAEITPHLRLRRQRRARLQGRARRRPRGSVAGRGLAARRAGRRVGRPPPRPGRDAGARVQREVAVLA